MTRSLLFCALAALSPMLLAQQPSSSSVPASVRAMIEQSQAGSRFDSMARMQVDRQYGEFISQLDGLQKRSQVEQRLVDVISERAEMSSQTVTGRVTPAELQALSSYGYLRSQLAPLLSEPELALLDAQQGQMAEQNLRRNYTEQMERVAPGIVADNRALLLDTLVEYMLFTDSNSGERDQSTAADLVNQQLMTLRAAREELQNLFSGEQLQQVNVFLDHLRSNLFLSTSMDSGAVQ